MCVAGRGHSEGKGPEIGTKLGTSGTESKRPVWLECGIQLCKLMIEDSAGNLPVDLQTFILIIGMQSLPNGTEKCILGFFLKVK